uniref:Toll-like receptor 26.2 n=1 Tax=Littorina littorea TaxID=31216 RepID=A0A7G8ZA24_LITLI|nr:toll-like receptor 26.2 [Littorina littorea]
MGTICFLYLWLATLLVAHGFRGTGPTNSSSDNIPICMENLDMCLHIYAADRETCGENWCQCCNRVEPHRAPMYAYCMQHYGKLTYIPKLPGIEYLDLKNNFLTSHNMTERFFTNITHITCLVLAQNKITWLDQSMFRNMKNLKCLSISGNPLQSQTIVRSMLSVPGLQALSAAECGLPMLNKNLFQNISSDVKYFWFDENSINTSTYDMTVFCPLTELQNLALRVCNIKYITSECPLKIESLDLYNNLMDNFPKTCMHNNESMFPNLTLLSLEKNRISSINEACLPKLRTLDLTANLMIRLTENYFDQKNFPVLTELDLKSNAGATPLIPNNTFSNPSLIRLSLDDNRISFDIHRAVETNAFANSRIMQLSLTGNTFKNIDNGRFVQLFGHLPLRKLKLSKNKLDLLALKTLWIFKNLELLDLERTEIASLPDGAFDSFRNLVHLDLSDNKITSISELTFNHETRQRLKVLFLDNNPFICSCDLMWFKEWFVSQPKVFLRHTDTENKYTCENIPGVNLTDFSMAKQACLLSQSLNVMIVFTCTLVIVTLTIASLVFRFRWNIRLALYEAFRGRGDVRMMRLLTDHFDYDVFVSYAKEDLPWVYQRLMPELESRLGLRLCVHERDFIPGNNIVDNIVESVQSSKKILMVFSKDFVRSQWCQFELTFCMNHVMNYDDVLLIVCVDDVASRDMTAAMMAVLKTTTYIQWEELDDAVDSFWGRLRLALHEIIPRGGALP